MPLLLLPYSSGSGAPIYPGTIVSAEVVRGPQNLSLTQPIRPLTIPSEEVVSGVLAPPLPELLTPIRPMTIPSGEIVNGGWLGIPEATAAEDPYANLLVISVKDTDHAIGAAASPQLNDKGTGSYAVPREDRPLNGTFQGVNVGGRRVFTGIVNSRDDTQFDVNPARELCTVNLVGALDDWDKCIVLPDFGAQDVTRLGRPIQDTRFFDWTMNGLATDLGRGEPGLDLIPSLSVDAGYGTARELFPMPDVWPDPTARWMWVTNPYREAPKGWCHFRVPFYAAEGETQVWACAHDYADIWLDGVQIATCDQPGIAQRITVNLTADFHLLTIRAYNTKGRAGVLASVLPVTDDGLYGPPWMNSRSNWKALAYPKRSFRLTPGRVIRRLHLEAQRRGVTGVGDWELDFGPTTDTAGRPWPQAPLIQVPVGISYFGVLKQLAEDLVDFAPSPSGRRLRMWVKDEGSGRNVDVPWTEGVDLESQTLTTSNG